MTLTFPYFATQAAWGLASNSLCIREGSRMSSPHPPPPSPPLASFTKKHWLYSLHYTGTLRTSPCLHTRVLPSSWIMRIQLACSTLCVHNQTTMDFLPLLSTSCCSTTCCCVSSTSHVLTTLLLTPYLAAVLTLRIPWYLLCVSPHFNPLD